jgi:hypothetical protein
VADNRNDKCRVVIPGTLRDRPRGKFFLARHSGRAQRDPESVCLGRCSKDSGGGDASEAR